MEPNSRTVTVQCPVCGQDKDLYIPHKGRDANKVWKCENMLCEGWLSARYSIKRRQFSKVKIDFDTALRSIWDETVTKQLHRRSEALSNEV